MRIYHLPLRWLVPFIMINIFLASSLQAADLYLVAVESEADALTLAGAKVDAVKRLSDGYLLLCDRTTADRLAASGLDVRLIAADVRRSELAIDASHAAVAITGGELLFDERGVRLYRLDASAIAAPPGLARVMPMSLPIVYREPASMPPLSREDVVDLDSLIDLISEDSCRSYVEQMQTWDGRYPGHYSHFTARNWLIGKLTAYGCDSVAIDEFEAEDSHTGEIKTWENVVGHKVGSVYPVNQIVIGAHWDCTPLESPGADDNATGCAAVLEIARVLCQADTRFTFVFVLFDSEEVGLNGSIHYATEAFNRGDSITVMANLDVLGYYTGIDSVLMAGAFDGAYADVWRHLADSLTQIDIRGAVDFGLLCDAGAFADVGYEALSVYEYILNPFMHSVHDSAVYLDFGYVSRITKATLAATYVVNATYPGVPIGFSMPDGIPELFYPNRPVSLEITANTYGDASFVPGSALIHYVVDDDPPASAPLIQLGGDVFQAVLPAQPCNSYIRYYFSVDEITSGTWYYPDTTSPFAACVATHSALAFEDDFNTDLGWTVMGDATEGMWERGIPYSNISPPTGPPADHDHSGYCYLTGNAHAIAVCDGTARLISPFVEVPNGRVLIKYARWFDSYDFSGTPFNDVFQIFVRRDGTSLVLAETVGPVEESNGGWFESEFWVNDFLQPTAPIQVMFDVSDTGAISVLEGAVDAFEVMVYTCEPLIITEQLPDWTADVPYAAQQLEAVGGDGTFAWADKNNDLSGTGLTLSTAGVFTGTPVASGTLNFTAVATDGELAADEKQYTMQINAPVTVTTEALSEATEGTPYSEQLLASGGTGNIAWSDRDNDLSTLGLSLNPEGLLSGTPTDTGSFTFTARAEDEVGSIDEVALILHIGPAYVCGDVDNNGVGIDISDITYFVDWMFGGGPAPPIMEAANVDFGSGGTEVDISDLTYMADFMFGGGPAPDCD
jgi:hypothetical protein